MGVVPGSGDTVVVSGDVSRERDDGAVGMEIKPWRARMMDAFGFNGTT